MKEWKNRPTDITLWGKDVDNILFVDENNSDTTNQIIKKLKEKKEININERYFTLTGCIIKKRDYEFLKEEIEFIKNKYWKDAKYFYERKQEERIVCFHSKEIRNRTNAFYMQEDQYNEFMNDLSQTIKNTKFQIITVNIDIIKFVINNDYNEVPLYEYAFEKLVEAYERNINNSKKGIIVIEARGKKEDTLLHKYAVKLLQGNYDNIIGLFFNAKWNKYDNTTYAGLELADLCSYPIHKYIKIRKKDRTFKIIEDRILEYKSKNNEIEIFPQKNRD